MPIPAIPVGVSFAGTILGAIKSAGLFLLTTFLGLLTGIIKIAVGLGLAQIIAILGIGTISYQGFSYTLDWAVQQMQSVLVQLPPDQMEILSVVATQLRVDDVLTVIFSAYATVLAMWTFQGTWKIFGFGSGS